MKQEDRFEHLATLLCEMAYFEKESVKYLLSSHYDIMKTEDFFKGSTKDLLFKKRAILSAKKDRTSLIKLSIEQQLLSAKSRLKNGEDVDTDWMSRANYAFKMKKLELSRISEQFGRLKSLEKLRNVQKSTDEGSVMYGNLVKSISRILGESVLEEVMADAQLNAKAELNRKNEQINKLKQTT